MFWWFSQISGYDPTQSSSPSSSLLWTTVKFVLSADWREGQCTSPIAMDEVVCSGDNNSCWRLIYLREQTTKDSIFF